MKLKLYSKYAILITISLVVIVALLVVGPIPNPIEYYNFADQRTILHLPNFFNVLSNLFFLLAGVAGLYFLFGPNKKLEFTFKKKKERLFFIIYFIGLFTLGFTSAYFHWNPTQKTLIWDRLSLVLIFESFFAAMLGERINMRFGLYMLFPLLLLGIFSVIYWGYTESIGKGDLRLYIIMQFLPIILTILLLLMFKPMYTKQMYIWLSIGSYIIAKICEHSDYLLFRALHHMLSGHTLKHLFAALATYLILVYLKSRRPIP